MKQKILFGCTVLILILVQSCNREPNNSPLQQKTKSQTNVMQLLQTIDSLGILSEYNLDIVKDYIAKAEEFCANYPEDLMAAELLYQAGLMAMTLAKTSENTEEKKIYSQKALTFFEDIQKIYPEFYGIKNCIINKGIIYEDILHDYENAEIFYREYIARYPTDTLAINLESYLPFLGKSPEEIMKEFGKE